jgi:hypothetical protein
MGGIILADIACACLVFSGINLEPWSHQLSDEEQRDGRIPDTEMGV